MSYSSFRVLYCSGGGISSVKRGKKMHETQTIKIKLVNAKPQSCIYLSRGVNLDKMPTTVSTNIVKRSSYWKIWGSSPCTIIKASMQYHQQYHTSAYYSVTNTNSRSVSMASRTQITNCLSQSTRVTTHFFWKWKKFQMFYKKPILFLTDFVRTKSIFFGHAKRVFLKGEGLLLLPVKRGLCDGHVMVM